MAHPTPPRDRFDDAPDLARVGAHRAPAARRGLVTLAWAALATGALVGAGVLGLGAIESGVGAPVTGAPVTGAPVRTAAGPAPTVDPDVSVVVLNATSTAGLAASASKAATGAGWKVASTANADVQDRATSTVYYADASQLGAARGLARSLGIDSAPERSDQFVVAGRSRLTVVLGRDFRAG